MQVISRIIAAAFSTFVLSVNASALDIYSVKSTSQKIATISDNDFGKNPTVYKTVDPNFAGMKPADYSGVSIEKIASLAKLGGDDVVTFLCKDNYIMSETIATLLLTNALVANRLGGVDILPKSGGPITMVHKTITTNDLYPWYITSIVVGTVDHPTLRITSEHAVGKDVPWDKIAKSKDQETSPRIFPAPRGRRPKADTSSEISRKITSLPLSTLTSSKAKIGSKAATTGSTVNYTLIDGQVISKKYSPEEFRALSLVNMIEGKAIQVRHGGPFIVSSSLAKASELPIFYLSSIEVIDSK